MLPPQLAEVHYRDELARPILDRLLAGPDLGNPVYRALPRVPSYFVLAARFIRPDSKDLGGGKKIYFSGKTRDEDIYQGVAGLVIGIGPDAYKADKYRNPSGPSCKLGDWIVARDSWAWPYRGLVMMTVRDDFVHAVVDDPRDTIEAARI